MFVVFCFQSSTMLPILPAIYETHAYYRLHPSGFNRKEHAAYWRMKCCLNSETLVNPVRNKLPRGGLISQTSNSRSRFGLIWVCRTSVEIWCFSGDKWFWTRITRGCPHLAKELATQNGNEHETTSLNLYEMFSTVLCGTNISFSIILVSVVRYDSTWRAPRCLGPISKEQLANKHYNWQTSIRDEVELRNWTISRWGKTLQEGWSVVNVSPLVSHQTPFNG